LSRHHFFFKGVFFILSSAAFADPIIWFAESPANDMNDSDNWNPDNVPVSTDDAIFDSSIPGVSTNPTESFSPFSVLSFQFPTQAPVFHIQFNNQTLNFTGTGIEKNPVIQITNTDNSGFPGNLISFTGATGTSGSANITSSNSATLTGNQPGVGIGAINTNFYAQGPFSIDTGGIITASNTGINTTISTGNNGTANTGSSQVRFDQTFSAGNNVTVSVSNSGTYSGSNTVQGNSVAIVNGSQFISLGAFAAGDNFSCSVQNTGNDSSAGVGLNNIGQINAAQVILQGAATVGNDCTMSVSNTGINSSQTTSFPDFIGYLNDEQLFVANTFQAGDRFSLTVTNTGTDTSTGHGGHQVAVINSNSGTTGNQVHFGQSGTLGNQANISVSNSGTYSGTNTTGGPNVGGMNLGQFAAGDNTAIGTFAFNAGNQFSLNVSNSGINSGQGLGNDAVGTISTNQASFFSPCTLGNNATMTVANTGNFSGQSTASFVNVGSAGGNQLGCFSTFQSGENFNLNITNSGTSAGSGIGNNFIGDLSTGQQAGFYNGLTVGNNASITISNSGTNSSSTSNHNQTGSLMGYGKQLFVQQPFQAGDNLLIEITNTGFDDSTNAGGNFVGFINNNTGDGTGSQIHLGGGAAVGNRATITVSNTGTSQGSTDANVIAALSGHQFNSLGNFQAGDNFGLTVTNTATNNGLGHSNNNVGTMGAPQVQFGGTFTAGNQAAFVITNTGVNHDATGTSNNIGMSGAQMLVEGAFAAGTSLNITVRNQSTNAGDNTNLVGYVNGSQIAFVGTCTLNDKSSISAFNFGRVIASQIVFSQGFDVASGKATIQAVNDGTVGSFGIDIQGNNAGGNAEIILGNSSLNIGANLPAFTIAGLQGDSTSTAQSQPLLVINTDAVTKTEFAGVIQDFPATMSTLTKTGPGTQKLSGANTYSGLTTVQEGTLIVSGSLAEDILVAPLGTLKGNGLIGGTVTNTGTIAPGESIGTMNVTSYSNNGGTYNVEVNGSGQSDLINVLGAANISGGTVAVSTVDGAFRLQQPYTIITAQGGVTGTFARATSLAFINPILTYGLNNVFLTINSALINAASSCNQYGVARNLDNLTNLSAAQALLISAIANLPLRQARSALESLSGFQYTNGVWATEVTTRRFLRRLYDPLRPIVSSCDCCCPDWTIWLEGGYGFTNLHKKTAHKLHMDSYQVTGGIQKTFCCDFTVGLAGSYEYDHMKYRHGDGHRNSGYASLYGLYRPCCFYGLVDFVYGYSADHVNRKIHAGNVRYRAHGNPHLNLFAFYGEFGFDWCACDLLIQPFLGVQVDRNWRGHIRENDANGFGLNLEKHNWTEASTRLGVHITYCDICDYFNASLDLAWDEMWTSDHNSTRGRFKQFGNSYRICGNTLDRASFDYALTLSSSCFCDCLTGYLELGGEVWGHANTFNVILGVEYNW
jgi:autotransporter-associated beta strand protein